MRGKWDTCCALQLRTIRQNENNGVCAPVEVENQAANSILHGFQSTFGSVRKKKEKRKRRKKGRKQVRKRSPNRTRAVRTPRTPPPKVICMSQRIYRSSGE